MGDSKLIARAVGRVSGRMLRRNAYVNAGIAAGKTTLRAAAKTTRVLWLEVTGFFFAAFAVIGVSATIREYLAYSTGTASSGRVAIAAAFTIMFAYFSISSFYRSRRIRNS